MAAKRRVRTRTVSSEESEGECLGRGAEADRDLSGEAPTRLRSSGAAAAGLGAAGSGGGRRREKGREGGGGEE